MPISAGKLNVLPEPRPVFAVQFMDGTLPEVQEACDRINRYFPASIDTGRFGLNDNELSIEIRMPDQNEPGGERTLYLQKGQLFVFDDKLRMAFLFFYAEDSGEFGMMQFNLQVMQEGLDNV